MDDVERLRAELAGRVQGLVAEIRELEVLVLRLNALEAEQGLPATVLPLFPSLEDGDGDGV